MQGEDRPPCPACGSTAISIAVTLHESVGPVTDSVSYVARTTNTASTRRRALEEAVDGVAAAIAAGSPHDAQRALKAALEAIHELSDCHSNGDWSQTGWTADDIGFWRAHVGARNAAHHTSSALAALHNPAPAEESLRWEIDPKAIASLRSELQRREYNGRLDREPVLPLLRALAAQVSAAVP